jgi:hypothetical protein
MASVAERFPEVSDLARIAAVRMRSERPVGTGSVGNLRWSGEPIALSVGGSQPVNRLRPVSRSVTDVLN